MSKEVIENKKKRVYYAHSMLHYSSQVEHDDVELLQKMGYEVENPNNERNEAEYLKTHDFDVFLRLVRSCDLVAFRGVFGKISTGVKTEIDYAKERDIPVIELPTFTSDRFLSIAETRAYCRPKSIID